MNLSEAIDEANQHESYHDYIGRRLREQNDREIKTVDERDEQILELKSRIKRLEEDMARILQHHE
tara:strand:+ start:98 stop:292 length:195 start_codon:yes stop_codon:yes gene_type:complete